jgi:antitoxin component YwqK of YwqJK toxin-antitoxin module
MIKYSYFVLFSILLTACNASDKVDVKETPVEEVLTVTENGVFTEYYPGKKQIKFRGSQDDEGQRHGQWIYYSENGTELSVTHYHHGVMHGHSVVKYPDGRLHYIGEYDQGKEIGIWIYYDDKGNKSEKNYDQINK